MVWTRLCAALAVALVALAAPVSAPAAPEGKVVIAQGVDPSTLDAMNQQETPASVVATHIYDTLVERDQSLKVVPALGHRAPEAPRPHGVGDQAPQGRQVPQRRGLQRGLRQVQPGAREGAVDARQLQLQAHRSRGDRGPIHGEGPHDQALADLRGGPDPASGFHVSPKAYAGKDSPFISKNPIGTGPYRLVRWSKDEEILLEAWPQYWRGAAKIKNVVFRPIPDDAVRVAALQNGEVDVAVNIPPHMANIIANHPKIFLTTAPSIRTIQLMFYTAQFDAQNKLVGPYQGPTADKRVRQAITLALDADEIIKGVLDGKAQRVATLLPSMHFGYDPSLKPVKQDVAKAKKLLAEAGFPNGLEIQLNSPQGRYVRDKEVAEAAAGQLTKAGIKTTLKTFEFVNYLNNMVYVHKAGPVWLIGWGQAMMDAEGIYVPLFHTGSLLSNYHNPDFDGMVDQAQTMMDEKQRLAQYFRINKLWLDDQPAAPLYQQIDLYGASKRAQLEGPERRG